MPRQAKLGKKSIKGSQFWHTKAGGRDFYFGKVGEVPHSEANKQFRNHLNQVATAANIETAPITLFDLAQQFLDWVKENRSERSYDERKRHLKRFCQHTRGGEVLADLPAIDITAHDLNSFLKSPAGKALDPFTTGKHQTSIRAAFRWGVNHSLLPEGPNAFKSIARYKRPAEMLDEHELPTADEIAAILDHADDDLGLLRGKKGFRNREPAEYREDSPYIGLAEMVRVYIATGARTHELTDAKVGDFQPSAGQIVLTKHKRSTTLSQPEARRIVLNGEALAIIKGRCKGRDRSEPIFTDPKGRAWERRRLDNRFQIVRDRAEVRAEITIYSFRHLWISQALMAGIPIASVSKMAGTSSAMIERVYDHYTSDHLSDAQAKLDAFRSQNAVPRSG